MNTEVNTPTPPEANRPDDRLREIPPTEAQGDDSSSTPALLSGFVLLKLNGYMKPPLAEELSDPRGPAFAGGCTCNSVCPCVPVETCACDAVCTCDTVSMYRTSSSGGGGGGYGGYYAPCF